jgi:two-component system, cell cycle sensor histidine kinase and response regulator CckA
MESFQKQQQIKFLPPFSVNWKFVLKEVDLNEVVRIAESVLTQYVNGDIDVRITLLENNLKIMADRALMTEALIHLIKNAMDAMPDGGKFSLNAGRVNLENRSAPENINGNSGQYAFVSLVDTGIGIDDKIKEKIFEPFFTTKAGNNTGLGLPIANHIIKELGGSMEVASTPGQGTAINIYLPLANPEIANMIPIPLPAPSGRDFFT